MDGDNAIQALALAVETDLGRRLRFNPLTTSIFNGATTASDITALVAVGGGLPATGTTLLIGTLRISASAAGTAPYLSAISYANPGVLGGIAYAQAAGRLNGSLFVVDLGGVGNAQMRYEVKINTGGTLTYYVTALGYLTSAP
jgi:hypothetical protein